jgi:tRNA threonylcarbamoyladenosine biosynthesis protein TsaB
MKYLLHIDTSVDTGTVAISGDGMLLATVINEATRNHAGSINIMINEVLAKAAISLNELSAIVVCAGPGSYTGLRIGMATAKGLCYAMDVPLIVSSRLTLLAYCAWKKHSACSQYVSLLLAREKEYFIGIYDKDFNCLLAPQHITEEQLNYLIEKKQNTHIVTDVAENVIANFINTSFYTDNNIKIDPDLWASYAFAQYKCNDIVNLSGAQPFYLKQVYTHN